MKELSSSLRIGISQYLTEPTWKALMDTMQVQNLLKPFSSHSPLFVNQQKGLKLCGIILGGVELLWSRQTDGLARDTLDQYGLPQRGIRTRHEVSN